ncbi:hypothetical protein HK104_006787 [Borealophlyctis nickersoniae]|nr:hypothetical protein HK104_006787 [Borealophlyctis nickersoniae]
MSRRISTCAGPTPFDRGRELGTTYINAIRSLYSVKLNLYRNVPDPLNGAHWPTPDLPRAASPTLLDRWHALTAVCIPYITTYAPITHQELLGAAQAFPDPAEGLGILYHLACEYEINILLPSSKEEPPDGPAESGHCTAFAMREGEKMVFGQTNDETHAEWEGGKWDCVVFLIKEGEAEEADECPDCMVYTHPGYPAYFGINGHNLAILWQYVNTVDADYHYTGGGVPTCVCLREVLKFRSIVEAKNWLESVQRIIPNSFMLVHPGVGMVDIEVRGRFHRH